VAGFYEHKNEPLCSKEGREFLDKLRDFLVSHEGFLSMKVENKK
jgi:hypothetical protein